MTELNEKQALLLTQQEILDLSQMLEVKVVSQRTLLIYGLKSGWAHPNFKHVRVTLLNPVGDQVDKWIVVINVKNGKKRETLWKERGEVADIIMSLSHSVLGIYISSRRSSTID